MPRISVPSVIAYTASARRCGGKSKASNQSNRDTLQFKKRRRIKSNKAQPLLENEAVLHEQIGNDSQIVTSSNLLLRNFDFLSQVDPRQESNAEKESIVAKAALNEENFEGDDSLKLRSPKSMSKTLRPPLRQAAGSRIIKRSALSWNDSPHARSPKGVLFDSTLQLKTKFAPLSILKKKTKTKSTTINASTTSQIKRQSLKDDRPESLLDDSTATPCKRIRFTKIKKTDAERMSKVCKSVSVDDRYVKNSDIVLTKGSGIPPCSVHMPPTVTPSPHVISRDNVRKSPCKSITRPEQVQLGTEKFNFHADVRVLHFAKEGQSERFHWELNTRLLSAKRCHNKID